METFGQILRKRRIEKGWTLEAVGRMSQTEKGYLSGVESGKLRASPRKTVLIAEAIGLDPKDMLLRVVVERAPLFVREELCERVFGSETRVVRMMEQYLKARRQVATGRLKDALQQLQKVFEEAFPGGITAGMSEHMAQGRIRTKGKK